MRVFRDVLTGLLGGAVGGALAGLGEASLIAGGASLDEYGVFPFALVCYGFFGAAGGAAWGLLLSVASTVRRVGPAAPFASSVALPAAGLLMLVVRFRVVRDVFAENLPVFSLAGLAVHAGIVAGAALLAFLLWRGAARAEAGYGGPVSAAASLALMGAIALLVALVLGSAPEQGSATALSGAAGDRPNVVLVIADTLRADHIGPYGSKEVATPNIDGLAADGIVFENAFAQSSWTRPSIATTLTSLYAGSHKVMYKTDLLPDEVTTVAEVFSDAGYRSSGFVTNINVAPSFNFEQGFGRYSYLAPDFFFGATDSGAKLALYNGLRLVRERFLSNTKKVNNYYQDADVVNAAALPWLEEQAGEPFFSLIHYMDAHDPYMEIPYNGYGVARVNTPHPAASEAAELKRLYISNVEYLDGFLGGLVAALKGAGVYDRTVIVLTADHGEEFYEHEGWWHGTTLYDEQIHIPLILKLAANERAGSRAIGLARLLDVAPTLAAAAGVEPGTAWQGRDLLGATPVPTAVYAEEDHEGNVLEALRSPGWKLVLANADNPRGLEEVELYDLAKDPGETRNLAGAMPDRVAALRADLEALRVAARAAAVDAVEGEIDEASRERLRALGYIQ